MNPKDLRYQSHGGRGITLCDRWQIFEHFLEDMGERPSRQHSIERINNDGNYQPGNCKWATAKEQARNRRSSRFLDFNGRKATVAEWAETTGVPSYMIRRRIDAYGWTVEKALTYAAP